MTVHHDKDKAKLKIDATALTPFNPIHEEIFELDLTTAHTNTEAIFEGAVTLTIIETGNGTWNLSFDHRTNVRYLSTWFQDMDLILREYTRIYFTNTAQTGKTNPTFLIGQRLRPVK